MIDMTAMSLTHCLSTLKQTHERVVPFLTPCNMVMLVTHDLLAKVLAKFETDFTVSKTMSIVTS